MAMQPQRKSDAARRANQVIRKRTMLIMALLVAIIVRVLLVARHAHTTFQCCICVGMAAMLIYQTVVNVGMCLFVMPVIGVTLPFFSYGGSSVVTLFMAMGLVSGIKKRASALR